MDFPTLEDLWHGRLRVFLAAALLYHKDDLTTFFRREEDLERARRLRRHFGSLFGWTPPVGALEWEGLLPAASLLPCAHPYTSFHPLERLKEPVRPASFSALASDDGEGLLQNLLSERTGVELLCTGLYSFGENALPFDSECRLSLLPHPLEAGEILVVDPVRTNCDERYASLAHFFLRRWNPSEVKEWLAEFFPDMASEDVAFALDPEALEGMLRAFEYRAKEERSARPVHLDPAALRRRSFWLFGHPGGDPYPGFARELGTAPAITDWEVETALFASAPWLTCYYLLAHLYLGNDQAAARTARMALQSRGEIVAGLARHVLRVLDDPEEAGLDAAAFHELRETTLMCARPWQLEPAARTRREELLAGLAHLGHSDKPDLWPAFLSTL